MTITIKKKKRKPRRWLVTILGGLQMTQVWEVGYFLSGVQYTSLQLHVDYKP
jgi:hypothetical protein